MIDHLLTLDATAQAEHIRRGDVSPLELVEATIARIEGLNPALNAVITPLFDEARAQAASPHLPEGPFRGVPLLVKDFLCEIANTPYYEGMGFLRALGWRSTTDTYLAGRFREAGFIFMGKTNLPELAGGPITDSAAFGPTRNPFDKARTAGGSSGGSAAAVASGMVAVAHANDGTGSIRIPASCCGLVGLKPSRGRISLGTGRSGGFFGNIAEFVLTRSARDAANILDAVAGNLSSDLFVAPPSQRPFAEEVGRESKKLRVGLLYHDAALSQLKEIDPSIPNVDPECITAVKNAGHLLAAMGHEVEENYPKQLEGPTGLGPALGMIASSGAAAALDAWAERTGRPIGPEDVEPATWARAELGRTFSAVQIHAAYQRMVAGLLPVADWWQEFDLLVTPTMAQLPPLIGAEHGIGAFGLFCMPFSFTGQPALSLPLHRSTQGLPVGVQLVAAYGREDLLLQIAAQLERAQPWIEHYPFKIGES
ncbi:MAG: amidase [Caldilineaceae bacterium]